MVFNLITYFVTDVYSFDCMILQRHLHNGVFVNERKYQRVLRDATTSALFVKNLSLVVFGSHVLATHSVKGGVVRGKNVADNEVILGSDGKRRRKGLDPRKLNAIKSKFCICDHKSYVMSYFGGCFFTIKCFQIMIIMCSVFQ